MRVNTVMSFLEKQKKEELEDELSNYNGFRK